VGTLQRTHQAHCDQIAGYFVKELKGFFHKIPSGYIVDTLPKNKGSLFKKYPLGMSQVNCFSTHNELTMYPLGKLPFAPSGCKEKWSDDTAKGQARWKKVRSAVTKELVEICSACLSHYTTKSHESGDFSFGPALHTEYTFWTTCRKVRDSVVISSNFNLFGASTFCL